MANRRWLHASRLARGLRIGVIIACEGEEGWRDIERSKKRERGVGRWRDEVTSTTER